MSPAAGAQAEARLARRRAALPAVSYPPELPVSQRRDDLLEAIGNHQVVVVAGETGSGKTTQLPKLCLELGRGIHGTIAHTQPRRLAARTVAERIADELDVRLGEAVGYAVRFSDRSRDDTLVRLVTDGLLLAEIRHDRLLRRYDTVIVDEAHERSLNIDFLLGYLKSILPRRPDLKLILTSATIDPQRFSRHFGDAPIVEVRPTYPVEVATRSAATRGRATRPTSAIGDAVEELLARARRRARLPLRRAEIRDTARRCAGACRPVDVLPLYARLPPPSSSGSSAALGPPRRAGHERRETSLTVPGIRYVVDPGPGADQPLQRALKVPAACRSSRSRRRRPTSARAAAGARRTGICIRLYSEEDFEARPRFTDPEILRTSLAAVILQMAAIGLGDVEDFPFLDPPDARQIRDGLNLLQELGALDPRTPPDRSPDRRSGRRPWRGCPWTLDGPDGARSRPGSAARRRSS
jgi:ATP-dependent helicase HrpA